MFAIANRPTLPAPQWPVPRPTGRAEPETPTPRPAPAGDDEEPRTFLRILLRALGAVHS